MTISKCYNCGSGQYTFYAENGGLPFVKCGVCGLLFVANFPDNDEILRANQEGKHAGVDVTGRFNPWRISQYLKVLDALFDGDLGSNKIWLDVGCGHGEFMVAVQKYSSGTINIKGMEPNVRKQESARKRGLQVSYFDIESHQEKYDIILLLNVYSYLSEPPMFLNSLKKLLKPSGELILETGDTADLEAKDHVFYSPGHLSFASERIVVDILGRVGFDIVKVKNIPLYDLIYTVLLESSLKLLCLTTNPEFRTI